MTEEQYCREALASLWQSYERAAKPYIDALVAIENRRIPQPIFLTIYRPPNLGCCPGLRMEKSMTEAIDRPPQWGGAEEFSPGHWRRFSQLEYGPVRIEICHRLTSAGVAPPIWSMWTVWDDIYPPNDARGAHDWAGVHGPWTRPPGWVAKATGEQSCA